MLVDYSNLLEELQKALVRRFLEQPSIINVPGRSPVVRLDQFYYLALYPDFPELLGKIARIPADTVNDVLTRTGSLVTRREQRRPSLRLRLVWPEGRGRLKKAKLTVCFLHADFIDRALLLYAQRQDPLPVSPLRIEAADKGFVSHFLADKTEVAQSVFYDSSHKTTRGRPSKTV